MSKQLIDLNSDMGEGFGQWQISPQIDAHIMPLISSANIATGFHAGDPNTMAHTVQLAREHGVAIGAHPAYHDLQGFGRRVIQASETELVNDMIYQIGALQAFAQLAGLSLQHVKPHGALYMTLATNESLSHQFLQKLQQLNPQLRLFCMEVSASYRVAQALGVPTVREFYADRDYNQQGSIVFTRQVGQLDPQAVAQKVLTACQQGYVDTVEGGQVAINFDSVCIHSDTPGALAILQATRALLAEHHIRIQSPSHP